MQTEIDPITAEVLHSAVHDLKGPANRLRLLAQLLTRSGAALDDDARQLLGHVENSAAAVGAVADGLRNYSEICTRPLRRQPLDLNLPLSSAMANLKTEIASVGGEVNATGLPVIQADPFLMTWMLQELIANAVRFRAAGPPRILVSSSAGRPESRRPDSGPESRPDSGPESESESWFVSFADNGIGIEPSMAERAFRPFKKLSGGTGAGLGLTICRKIVELHGGRIWVEPRTGGADIRFFVAGDTVGKSE